MTKEKYLLPLLLLAHTVSAQYPFEKFPAVKYKESKDWTLSTSPGMSEPNSNSWYHTISQFFDDQSLTIRMATLDSPAISYIHIYKGKHPVQEIRETTSFYPGNLSEPISIADINGDGLTDVKLIIPYHGNGLASMNVKIIYLFQRPGSKFTKISYLDKLPESGSRMWANRPERDMDKDGNHEIITMTLQSYKNHSYWLFNIYNYKNGELVNVNNKFGYPIMVQYLDRDNFTPAKFDKAVLQKFSRSRPEEYSRADK